MGAGLANSPGARSRNGARQIPCKVRIGCYNCEGFLSAAAYIAELMGDLDVIFLSETCSCPKLKPR